MVLNGKEDGMLTLERSTFSGRFTNVCVCLMTVSFEAMTETIAGLTDALCEYVVQPADCAGSRLANCGDDKPSDGGDTLPRLDTIDEVDGSVGERERAAADMTLGSVKFGAGD